MLFRPISMLSAVSYTLHPHSLEYSHHLLQTVQFNLIEGDGDHHHQFLDAVLLVQAALQTPEIKPFRLTTHNFLASLANLGEGIEPVGLLIREVAHHDDGRVQTEIVDLILEIGK